MSKLEEENKILRSIIKDLWWQAYRYSDGRGTGAPYVYNRAIKAAVKLGMEKDLIPDKDTGTIYARDK